MLTTVFIMANNAMLITPTTFPTATSSADNSSSSGISTPSDVNHNPIIDIKVTITRAPQKIGCFLIRSNCKVGFVIIPNKDGFSSFTSMTSSDTLSIPFLCSIFYFISSKNESLYTCTMTFQIEHEMISLLYSQSYFMQQINFNLLSIPLPHKDRE